MDGDAGGNTQHEIYHTGLRNLHALEQAAIELTARQSERLEHYPDMKAKLLEHNRESHDQSKRLEEIMARHGISPSSVKSTVTSVMGNVAAALHVPAGDEIIKNTLANFAFEHHEIASYRSLIAMAEIVGDGAAVAPLRQSLSEEEAMAHWIGDNIAPTTQRYMQLAGSGQQTAKV